MTQKVCPECLGRRLSKEAMGITIGGKSIADTTNLAIEDSLDWVKNVVTGNVLSPREKEISKLILKEIEARLGFLNSVGLEYLTLDRAANTLSGGEAQRIRLASQIGSGLTGVLYVLDEPTIGLHQRDNDRLIETLRKLRDLGNTVVVVEHDRDMISAADYIADFGPKAGKFGGAVVATGTLAEILKNPNSETGKFVSGERNFDVSTPPAYGSSTYYTGIQKSIKKSSLSGASV